MLCTTRDRVAYLALTWWKVRIWARKPSILTDTFHGFAFSLQASTTVVPTIGHDHFITNYFKLVLHESDYRRRCAIGDTESAVKYSPYWIIIIEWSETNIIFFYRSHPYVFVGIVKIRMFSLNTTSLLCTIYWLHVSTLWGHYQAFTMKYFVKMFHSEGLIMTP